MKNWFGNLRISAKLITGFLFVTFLGILIGVVGIINMISMTNRQQETYDECTLGIVYSDDAENSLLGLRTLVMNLYMYYDTDKAEYINKISTQLDTINTQIETYGKTISDSTDQANYDVLKSAFDIYKSNIDGILEAAGSGTTRDEIFEIIKNLNGSAQNALDAFEALSEYNLSLSADNLASGKASAMTAIFIMIGVIVLSVALALALGITISRSISKPMRKFAAFAGMIAVGDIDVEKVVEKEDRLWVHRKDEVGMLAAAFEKMIASTAEQSQKTVAIAKGDLTTEITVRSEHDVLGRALSKLVDEFRALAFSIVASAEQVDSGAKQVSESSTSLAQGSAEQASSVEELTASLEEITTQTAQNAQNAQSADALARNIKKDAEGGNAQMTEMLRAMDEINASSDNIKKIIKVIENIAFQTNILALNAAVEAARAGQYGKGFAVVAEEVKNLAGQSAKAAMETTELIENSIKKVGTGVRIASGTAEELKKIVEGISKTSELVGAIASASHDQTSALEQLNEGIIQVSQVVQSNAAAAQECAASSEELSGQAESLKECVAVFKLS
ncbi:MAG: methyl-accepting chemotaxis protein [Clostridia bacterium]|nr:methyl-accepting chemotaxis protein [Clostridia bacterium]